MRNHCSVFAVVITILLSGCGSLSPVVKSQTGVTTIQTATLLQDFDQQLFDLYRAKREAESHHDLMMISVVRARLSELGQSAFEQGKTMLQTSRHEDDRPTAVGFYRVANIASWQSKDGRVLSFSEAGVSACKELKHSDASAPRDCSMIRLAGPLAVHDQLLASVNTYQQKRKELATGRLPSSDLQPVVELFHQLEEQFNKTSQVRVGMLQLPVDQELVAHTDEQRRIIYCSAVLASTLAARVERVQYQSLPSAERMKTALQETKTSTDCLSS